MSGGCAENQVTGVDGCRSGWIALTLDTNTWAISHSLHSDGTTLLNANCETEVIAIDIPIGLTEQGAGECDQAGRAL